MDDTQTLMEIQNTPVEDTNLDKVVPSSGDFTPTDTYLPLSQAYKTLTLKKDIIERALKPTDKGFFEKVGAGIFLGSRAAADLPDNLKAGVVRAFSGHTYPNMTEDDAVALMDAHTRALKTDRDLRALWTNLEGYDDSHVVNLASAATSALIVQGIGVGVGLATMNPALAKLTTGVVGGAMAAGEASQEYAEDYYVKNNYTMRGYKGGTDALYALAHGSISGLIESQLGVENVLSNALKSTGLKAGWKGIARAGLAAAGGEAAEEALQEGSSYLFGSLQGSEDRTFGEFLQDALTNAVYGGIVGGVFGSGVHYTARSKMIKRLKESGYSEDEATKITDKMINDTQQTALKEIATSTSLRANVGEAFDTLVDKIETALNAAGFQDTHTGLSVHEYAVVNASDIASQVIRQARSGNVPTADILDLAQIEVVDNAIWLKPQELGTAQDINKRVKDLDKQIRDINSQLRVQSDLRQQLREDKNLTDTLKSRKAGLKRQRDLLKRLYNSKVGIEQEQKEKLTLAKQRYMKKVNPTADVNSFDTVVRKQAYDDVKLLSEDIRALSSNLERQKNAVIAYLAGDDTQLFDNMVLSGKQNIQRGVNSAIESINELMSDPELLNEYRGALKLASDMTLKSQFEEIVADDATFGSSAILHELVHKGSATGLIQSYTAKKQANKDGNNRLGKKDIFNDDDLYYQALKEQNPDSFDGDHCTSKSLTAVLMSRMNQFEDGAVDIQQNPFDIAYENTPIDQKFGYRQRIHIGDRITITITKASAGKNKGKFYANRFNPNGDIEILTEEGWKSHQGGTIGSVLAKTFDTIEDLQKAISATYSPNIYLQSAMYVNPRTDIQEFAQFVLDNPKNKQSYQNFNRGNIEYTLTSDTIKHGKREHDLTATDWANILNSLEDIVYGEVVNRKNYYGDKNIVLETRKGKTSYRVVITQSGGQNKITSAFKIKKARVPVPDSSNFGSVSSDTTGALSGLDSIINQLKSNVKTVRQPLAQGVNSNGYYDVELKVIVLGRNMNTMTLPHEMAHFWLDNTFSMFKKASKGELTIGQQWIDETNTLFGILGIDPQQETLTSSQQETFATMTEAVITGLAPVPDGATLPMTEYLNWIPEKYKSIAQIGFRNENGMIVHPVLDQSAVDFFNVWYGNMTLPPIPSSPARDSMTNPRDENGEIIPSTTETMQEREKTISKAIKDQVSEDETAQDQRKANQSSAKQAETAGALAVYDGISGITVEGLPEDSGWFKRGERHKRDEMVKKAREYVRKNADHARDVALLGKMELNDTGVDLESLILAVMEFDKVDASSDLGLIYTHNIAMVRSEAGTILGLRTQGGSYQMYNDAYRRMKAAMTEKAAYKYAGRGAGAVDKFNSDIDALIVKWADKVFNQGMDIGVALRGMMAEASVQFTGEEGVLHQLDLTQAGKTRQVFIAYANRLIKQDIAKAQPNAELQRKLLEMAPKAEKAAIDLNSSDITVAKNAALALRDWSNLVRSEDMSQSMLGKAINTWAPRAMLSGISTHVTNIVSNSIEQTMVRGSIASHYGENIVPQSELDNETARVKTVYNESGMNLTTMITSSDPSLVHGEKYKPLDPKAKTKAIDPLQWLSMEDNLFRIPTYIDVLSRMASRDANGDVNKAKELFRQYASTQPKKINGQDNPLYKKRQEAILVASMATFTQNGKLAGALNKMRDALNQISFEGRSLQLGTMIAPFVKTPANIIESGLRAPYGALKTAYKKLAGGEITIEDTVDTAHFIGFALVGIIAAAFCDYEPPYKGGKYEPNKPYDSIEIVPGVWVKIDTLGVIESPLRLLLSMRDGATGAGIKQTISATPLIGELTDSNLNYALNDPLNYAGGLAYNQIGKLTPTIARQIAKPIIRETGLSIDANSTLGRKFARRWGLDETENTVNDFVGLLFNRIKITE